MSDRLLKESDVLRIAFQLPIVVNSAFADAVKALPSADRSQGKWIRDRYWSRGVGMGEEYGFFYKCSMCEYEVESGYTRCGFNYCPYCGCRMKGADDES